LCTQTPPDDQVFEPADALGMYGKDPVNPEQILPGAAPKYVATGDSGQGMTGSAIAGAHQCVSCCSGDYLAARVCGAAIKYVAVSDGSQGMPDSAIADAHVLWVTCWAWFDAAAQQ
jgi:hypothetical protein